MTAYTILLHELAQHGQTTYKALTRKYPDYTYYNFTSAVPKARRPALPARAREGPIVAVGCCPCCGRSLGDRRVS